MTRGSVLILMGYFLLTCCSMFKVQDATMRFIEKEDLLAGVSKHILANGLTVILKEDHSLPYASIFMCYNVGSVNETPGITGISHFLEHMLFKGTENYKRDEIDKFTALSGGELNAFTSNDITGYWFFVSSDSIEKVLRIEADRMKNALFEENEFEKERGVVLEEYARQIDNPDGRLWFEMAKAVFKKHPYNHPVIGFQEDLKIITRQQMIDYYRKYYIPNNAILVIVGDINSKTVLAKIKEIFEEIPPSHIPVIQFPQEPPQKQEERIEIETNFKLHRLGIAYKTDKIGSPTDYILDVVSYLLSTGRTSRLYKRLVEKDKTVIGIATGNATRKYAGVFDITATLKEGVEPSKVEKAIEEEIQRLRMGDITQEELQMSKNKLIADFVYGLETYTGYAIGLGRTEATAPKGIKYLNEYLKNISKVDAEDITECVKKYFTSENKTVVILKASKEGKSVESGGSPPSENPHRKHRLQEHDIKLPELTEVYKTRLENGLTVLIKNKPDLPIVSIQAYVNASRLYEPAEKAGVAYLVGEMLDEGTFNKITGLKRTHLQIAEIVESVGGRLATSSTGVSMKFLSRDINLGLELLRDMLVYPSFPEDRLNIIKSILLERIKADYDDPRFISRRHFEQAVFKGHPFQHPEYGYPETIQKITVEDLVEHHRKYFHPQNTIIAIVGRVDPLITLLEVKKHFAQWPPAEDFKLPDIPKIQKQESEVATGEAKETEQAHIYMGHIGIDRFNPDFYALQVMDYIVGLGPGFIDRLSRVVREQMGAAYEVWGGISAFASESQGALTIYLGVDPQNKDKAISAVKEVYKQFLKEGPTDEELNFARTYLLKRFARVMETADSICGALIAIERFDLGLNYPQKYKEIISSITREDVIRVARKYINPDTFTISVVSKP